MDKQAICWICWCVLIACGCFYGWSAADKPLPRRVFIVVLLVLLFFLVWATHGFIVKN